MIADHNGVTAPSDRDSSSPIGWNFNQRITRSECAIYNKDTNTIDLEDYPCTTSNRNKQPSSIGPS
jgi:hypothetical protein